MLHHFRPSYWILEKVRQSKTKTKTKPNQCNEIMNNEQWTEEKIEDNKKRKDIMALFAKTELYATLCPAMYVM